MSPLDARVLLVAADAERDWQQVETNLRKATALDPALGEPESAYVALALDHAYEAFETMLVRVERAVGLPERSGAAWHRALLGDAARELPGVRPLIVPPEVLADWVDLLGFRHFLRHAYAAELEAEKLRAVAARLARAVAATRPSVQRTLEALRKPTP